MPAPLKKTPAFVASAIAVGLSTAFLGVAPASAAPTCSNGAILVSANVCELRITTVGATTITPTSDMTQLEVLLVGGGGNGARLDGGYGAGGGGGEVTVVGFGTDTSSPIVVEVGAASQHSSVTQGATSAAAQPGSSSFFSGGTSGNGNGPFDTAGLNGGGGAGASPTNGFDGGTGAIVADIAPPGSLFTGVTECFGGGGAFGAPSGPVGTATCGGGYLIVAGAELVPFAPTPNSGGGAGGGGGAHATAYAGASGVVVLRWVELYDVTVTFNLNGRGTAVAPQTFNGGEVAVQPAEPTAEGYTFNGWFTDAALTNPVDFSAPVTASTTFYASWTQVLAATGSAVSMPLIGFGLGAVSVGAALIGLRRRRGSAAS